MKLNKEDKKFLLKIARESIEYYLKNEKLMDIEPGKIPHEKFIKKRACFVSLYGKGKELRGCIGMLEAVRPLVLDVVTNAVAAAVHDPRFSQVRLEELKDLKISISVLTEPKEVEIKNWKELLEKLVPKKHGLIIRKGLARATFLPIVWEQLPKKEQFLENLCMKAGLGKEEWKEPGMKFFFYKAIEFEE